jgi:hypothetical protein
MTYIASFLKQNLEKNYNIELMDLNAVLHKNKFAESYKQIKHALEAKDLESYTKLAHTFNAKQQLFAKESNNQLRDGILPENLQESITIIRAKNPDLVLLSLVYNSQVFFSIALAKELKNQGIKVIVGGPSVTPQLKEHALYLPHEVALLEHIKEQEINMEDINCKHSISFQNKELYPIPEIVIPLRTTSSCYYQKCSFCTHHKQVPYTEFDLTDIKQSIILSQAKFIFFVDDMIHKDRMLALAKILKPLKVHWMCQLKPVKDYDAKTLKTLKDAGLEIILWGVESGSNRLLQLMKKGTNKEDISKVLADAHKAGIKNISYLMFGFPSETKEEFLETMQFIKDNKESIDLVSTTVFGLQEGAPMLNNPEAFCIKNISRDKRLMLPDKISYEVSEGLHATDAKLLRKKYAKTIEGTGKYPKEMNIFREHMLYWVSESK